MAEYQTVFLGLWTQLVSWIPTLIYVIIVLLIGWIAGRALGKGISKVLDKAGVDDALKKTAIGKALERSGVTTVGFFDLIIRWFVYLIAILAAVNILNITILSNFMTSVVSYLPSLLAGVLIILIGFIVIDFIGDSLIAVGREAKIEYMNLFADVFKLFLYFVIIIMGLEMMKIDTSIVYVFSNALAWGAAAGVAVGLGIAFGWGFKDVLAEKSKEWLTSTEETAKRTEEVRARREEL
ncbi:MAG: hypothetical protein GTN80_07355 [Nitrososphaeria archaeon]|nr:hypothetical protein [Nitrososphaeria archaeon]NIQ33442.1 hypothetical protein [Nitrososphaeria archaeon]